MRRKVSICVVCLAALSVVIVCARNVIGFPGATTAVQKTARRGASQPAIDVKSVFNQRCARCHGLDGRAKTLMGEISEASDFTDRKWQESVSDQRMANSINQGRGEMPAFKNKLSQKQVKALVAYIRKF